MNPPPKTGMVHVVVVEEEMVSVVIHCVKTWYIPTSPIALMGFYSTSTTT
jgi:hypothetical protein